MSEQKSPITDFVATDDSGGFFNLRTGRVLSVDEMLCRYTRSELESIVANGPAQSVATPATAGSQFEGLAVRKPTEMLRHYTRPEQVVCPRPSERHRDRPAHDRDPRRLTPQ